MIINAILEVLEDGRFVAVYDNDQIVTMACEMPDIRHFDNPRDAFLAGVAFARLAGTGVMRDKVRHVESEEL